MIGYTALHNAVSQKKHRLIRDLVNCGANVNARANSGYTPLHLAASAGHVRCIEALLSCGADMSLTDDYGNTPKDTAALNYKKNIVRLLKSRGEWVGGCE